MRKFILQILLMCFITLPIACQPKTCINCGKPNKPEYYNKEKAREARKMMRQNHKSTATGGKSDFDPSAKEKKTKGNGNENPPKL